MSQVNKLYKVLAAVMCLALLVSVFPQAARAEELGGGCGDDLRWSFADGRLTISGTGEMTDYNQIDMPPWYEFRERIYYLSLPDGLTRVGNMAFYDCYNLTAAIIPATVTHIGKLAFCQCTDLAILNLNSGLKSIGRSAFERCNALQSVRLPDTLTEIDYHAFYCCDGLQYLTIPASVTQMGSGIFAYCENLLRVEIAAPLSAIPSWTFYGCTNLNSVILHEQVSASESDAFTGCDKLTTIYYGGDHASDLRDQISEDLESFGYFGTIMDTVPSNTTSSNSYRYDDDGTSISASTTVSQTNGATVSTTDTITAKDEDKTLSTDVTATIFEKDGWQELIEAIEDAIESAEKRKDAGFDGTSINVDVFVSNDSGVPSDVLNTVAEKDISMTVQTENGTRYGFSGTTLEKTTEETENVQLTFELLRVEQPDFDVLKDLTAFSLRFNRSSELKIEIMLRVGADYGRDTATLYQVDGKQLTALQSVIVDTAGYAHFYLANIDAQQQYYIGLNAAEVKPEEVIVPKEFYNEYGINTTYPDFSQYAITGVSSWGVSMKSVTVIMMAVMTGCAVAIGVTMYLLNKRKLRRGYVPDISEEDTQ